jgi:pyruvate/2-oxoacid:ferredoxin oxidoreductase beta subunit
MGADSTESLAPATVVLRPGNTNCPGCGMSNALRLLERALEDTPLVLCIPAGCAVVTAGLHPTSAYGVPCVATTFASAAAIAAGIRIVQNLNGDPGHTVCWAGDGATYDIGVATLSAAAERDEDIIYICYDNEVYGNTGGQRSSSTPLNAVTTTTPSGKRQHKKNIMAIVAAHRVPYAATLSLAHTDDFLRKVRFAAQTRGFRFLLIHSPCPTGWKSEPAESIELSRLAVTSGLFPLYEVFDGRRYRINVRPSDVSPADYFRRQGRFAKTAADFRVLNDMKQDWEYLENMAQAFPAD